MISIKEIKLAFKNIKNVLSEKREYLNRLDSKIGDSDHGESVTKAFLKVDKIVDEYNGEDIGELLNKLAFSVISFGGAAMGPLYGTALLRASKVAKGKTNLNYQNLKAIIKAMEEGIKYRGKVKVGDKTMLDTIHPAVEAFSKTDNLEKAITLSIKAAEEGMKSTKNMKAKVGRASRLGERSVGHIDPGAASMYFIIKEFLGSLCLKKRKG